MSSKGAFTFVLHSHLPYARMAGRWPHGEEWIHEGPLFGAMSDSKKRVACFGALIDEGR